MVAPRGGWAWCLLLCFLASEGMYPQVSASPVREAVQAGGAAQADAKEVRMAMLRKSLMLAQDSSPTCDNGIGRMAVQHKRFVAGQDHAYETIATCECNAGYAGGGYIENRGDEEFVIFPPIGVSGKPLFDPWPSRCDWKDTATNITGVPPDRIQVCKACPTGQFTPGPGYRCCFPCGGNRVTQTDSSGANSNTCVCDKGYYQDSAKERKYHQLRSRAAGLCLSASEKSAGVSTNGIVLDNTGLPPYWHGYAKATTGTTLSSMATLAVEAVLTDCSRTTLDFTPTDMSRTPNGQLKYRWQVSDSDETKVRTYLVADTNSGKVYLVGYKDNGTTPSHDELKTVLDQTVDGTGDGTPIFGDNAKMTQDWYGTAGAGWSPDSSEGIVLTVADETLTTPQPFEFGAQPNDCVLGRALDSAGTVNMASVPMSGVNIPVMTDCMVWSRTPSSTASCAACRTGSTTVQAGNNTVSDCVCGLNYHKADTWSGFASCSSAPGTSSPAKNGNRLEPYLSAYSSPIPTPDPSATLTAQANMEPDTRKGLIPPDPADLQAPYTEVTLSDASSAILNATERGVQFNLGHSNCSSLCTKGCVGFAYIWYMTNRQACRLYTAAPDPLTSTTFATRENADILESSTCSFETKPPACEKMERTPCPCAFGKCDPAESPPTGTQLETCSDALNNCAKQTSARSSGGPQCTMCPENFVTDELDSLTSAQCRCDNKKYFYQPEPGLQQCRPMKCTLPDNWSTYFEGGKQNPKYTFNLTPYPHQALSTGGLSESQKEEFDVQMSAWQSKNFFDLTISCADGGVGAVTVKPCVCGVEAGLAVDKCGPFSIEGECTKATTTENGYALILYTIFGILSYLEFIIEQQFSNLELESDRNLSYMRVMVLAIEAMGWLIFMVAYYSDDGKADPTQHTLDPGIVDTFRMLLYVIVIPAFFRFTVFQMFSLYGLMDLPKSGQGPPNMCVWTLPMDACADQDALVTGRLYQNPSVPDENVWMLYYSCANGYGGGNPMSSPTETVLGLAMVSKMDDEMVINKAKEGMSLGRTEMKAGKQDKFDEIKKGKNTNVMHAKLDKVNQEGGYAGVGMELIVNSYGTSVRQTNWDVKVRKCSTLDRNGDMSHKKWIKGTAVNMESCRILKKQDDTDKVKKSTVECMDEVDYRPEATATLADQKIEAGKIVQATNHVEIWSRRPIEIACNGLVAITEGPNALEGTGEPKVTVNQWKGCHRVLKALTSADQLAQRKKLQQGWGKLKAVPRLGLPGTDGRVVGMYFTLEGAGTEDHAKLAADVDVSESAASRFDENGDVKADPWITFCYNAYPPLPRRVVTLIDGKRVTEKEKKEREDEPGERSTMLDDDRCKLISLRINQICNSGLADDSDRKAPPSLGDKLMACEPCDANDVTCQADEHFCEVMCQEDGEHKTSPLLDGYCRTEVSAIRSYIFDTYCKDELRPKYHEHTRELQIEAEQKGETLEDHLCPQGYDPFSGGTLCCKRDENAGPSNDRKGIDLYKQSECPTDQVTRCPWPQGCNVRSERELGIMSRLDPDERERMRKELGVDLNYNRDLSDREQREYFQFD